MLALLGYDTLDALIDATVPGGDPPAAAARHPAGRSEHEVLAALRAIAAQEPGLPLVPRAGLPRHAHAAGDPAQHPGESRLVHGVHAVPGGDRAGTARGAAELPDDGDRPDRPGDRQRLAARRRHRGGRGDGAGVRRPRARRRRNTFFVADRCHPQTIDVVQTRAHARGIDRRRRRLRARRRSATTSSACCSSIRRPTARCSTTAQSAEQAHAAGALVDRGDGPAGLVLLTPPGEWGADVASATRSASACRSATAARTPRSSRRGTSSSAMLPGPHHRRVARRRRAAGAAHGAADARAAHPPREGDEQRLHGAGAARRDGRHVRRVSRPRGAHGASRGASTGTPPCSRRASSSSGTRSRTTTSSTRSRGARPAAGRRRRRGGGERARSTCARVGRATRHRRARRDGDRRRRARACSTIFAGGQPAPETERARRRGGRPLRRALRAHERLPHAPGLQHAPLRDGDAALHAAARAEGPVAHALDDPARLAAR